MVCRSISGGRPRSKRRQALWYLTLLCGFWVLFSTQLSGVDGVPRRYTDIIWTGFKSSRKLGKTRRKVDFYPILVVYILWGVIAMYLAKPFFMILVSATVGGYLLVITSLHTLTSIGSSYLRRFNRRSGNKSASFVRGILFDFGTLTVIQKVIVPYILPIFWGVAVTVSCCLEQGFSGLARLAGFHCRCTRLSCPCVEKREGLAACEPLYRDQRSLLPGRVMPKTRGIFLPLSQPQEIPQKSFHF